MPDKPPFSFYVLFSSRVTVSIAEAKTKRPVASGRETLEEYFPDDRAEEGSFAEVKAQLARRDRPPYFESQRGRQALEAIQAASSALQRATACLPTSDPGAPAQLQSQGPLLAASRGPKTNAESKLAEAPVGISSVEVVSTGNNDHRTSNESADAAPVADEADGKLSAQTGATARATSAEVMRRGEKTAQAAGGDDAISHGSDDTEGDVEVGEAPQDTTASIVRGATDADSHASATLAVAEATSHSTVADAVAQAANHLAVSKARPPALPFDDEMKEPQAESEDDRAEPVTPRPPTSESLARTQPLPPIGSPASAIRPGGAPAGIVTLMPQEVSHCYGKGENVRFAGHFLLGRAAVAQCCSSVSFPHFSCRRHLVSSRRGQPTVSHSN